MSENNAVDSLLGSNYQMRILVVDDNSADRKILKAMLNKMGLFDVHQSGDGMDAKQKILMAVQSNDAYELILMDWQMPKLDGLRLTQELRAEKATSRSAIMMLTAVADEMNVKEALVKGVDDYIVKPVQFEVLRAKIQGVLKKRPRK